MDSIRRLSAIVTVAGLAACSSSSKQNDQASTIDKSDTKTGTGKVQASSVADLGMTSALAIDLPETLTKKSATLRLAAGKKSIEACLMRESMGQLVEQIDQAKVMLCHIEAESSGIPFGKPVLLDFSQTAFKLQGELPPGNPGDPPPGGGTMPGEASADPSTSAESPESSADLGLIGVYVDNSNADAVKLYICQGPTVDKMKLEQAFQIEGSKSIDKSGKSVKVSKGTINMSIGDEASGMNFAASIGFDSHYTKSDTSALKLQTKFKFAPPAGQAGGGGGFSFAQNTEVVVNDSGLSKVSVSDVGSMSGVGPDAGASFDFKNAGVGLFNATQGNVFFTYDGGGQEPFSTQACVDSSSTLIDCGMFDVFKDSGELYLTAKDVPGVLPKDFTPAAPTGFDCAKADWSTKVKPSDDATTTAKHQACYGDISEDDSSDSDSGVSGSCFSSADYEHSSEAAEISFEQEAPSDTLEIPADDLSTEASAPSE